MPAENQTDVGYANVPQATASPSISGRNVVGATLTRTSGTYTNSPSAVNGQWTRNRADIAGATGATYVLAAADRDTQIGYYEQPSNANGLAPRRYHAAHTDRILAAEEPAIQLPKHSLGPVGPKRTFGGLGAEGANRAAPRPGIKVAIQGDSRHADIYADVSTRMNKTSFSFLNVANALLGQGFQITQYYAKAGNRSDQYLVESEIATIIASDVDYVSIFGFVNDLAQVKTAREIIATVEPVINRYLAAGKQVFLYTEPGAGAGSSGLGLNDAMISERNTLNTWLRDLANRQPGVRLFDLASVVLENPDARTSPVFKSEGTQSYSYDGTHYSYLGAHRIGEAFAEFLRGFMALTPIPLGAAGNLVPNVGFRTTTGGGIVAGITGTIPAGVNVNKVGSAITATVSTEPAAGLDNRLVANVTAGAGTAVGDQFLATVVVPITGQVALNDVLRGGARVMVDPGAVNVQSVRSTFTIWFDAEATNVVRNDMQPSDPKYQTGSAGGYSVVLSADELAAFRTGAAAVSRVDLAVRVHFAGPGSATLRIEQPSIRKVS